MWATTEKIREMMNKGEFLVNDTYNEIYPYFDEMVKKWSAKK
jgi:hypothetical protein